MAALAILAAAAAEAGQVNNGSTGCSNCTTTTTTSGPGKGGTVDAIHLKIAGFTYTGANAEFIYFPDFDELFIGGGGNGVFYDTFTNDFLLIIEYALSGTPLPFGFAYSTGTGQSFFSTNISVSAVPEPGTLALLGGGLLGLGLVLRRRKGPNGVGLTATAAA